MSLNRFKGKNTQGYLAKFLGSIEQKIWCLTFHICQNPTDFGWRPAPCQTSLHIIRESHKELPGGCADGGGVRLD